MNVYGQKARRHWQTYLPQRYAAIPDPETFFTDLGVTVATRIEELARAYAGSDRPTEAYLEKLGRLNMARFQAEGEVLREMVLLEPEVEDRE